ncbi:MAG: CPBP family intramembrane glutamic endopeptidase [Dokdonella sp.]
MNRSPPQLRIAVLLGIACATAAAALFPYVLALQPTALATASAKMHLPPAAVVAVQSGASGILCFLLAWAGLKLGAPLGLGAPWLAELTYGRERPRTSNWLSAIVLGAIAACVILGAIALFGAPIANSATVPDPVAWKGLLASPYGGIAEEIELRVFVMGCLAWLLARATGGAPIAWGMVIAVVTTSVLFGIGHLPLAAQLGPLTTSIVTRVIVYNALGGLVFGWLYWKRGLEHAMLAHFCADLAVHAAAPLAMGG